MSSPAGPGTGATGGSDPEAVRDVRQALAAAASVFVITFLTGLISHGLDLDHLSNARHAAESGIAAGLAALGVGAAVAVNANRHPRSETTP